MSEVVEVITTDASGNANVTEQVLGAVDPNLDPGCNVFNQGVPEPQVVNVVVETTSVDPVTGEVIVVTETTTTVVEGV